MKSDNDEVIKISNFLKLEVVSESEVVMFSSSAPKLDSEKRTISIPRISMLDCFKSEYLGEDYEIRVYEKNPDGPSITLFTAGITDFGKIEIKEIQSKILVVIEEMTFEYDSGYDNSGRFEDRDVQLLES